MQGIRPTTNNSIINIFSRPRKLRAKNLKYFDLNYESEYNKSIISSGRYVYYRDIFI